MKKSFLLPIVLLLGFLTIHAANPILNRANLAEDLVVSEFPWLTQNRNGLKLVSEKTSEMGTHFLFQHTHQGFKVYGSTIKMNLDKEGKLLSRFSSLKPIFDILPTIEITQAQKSAELNYYQTLEGWKIVTVKVVSNSLNENEELVLDQTGKELHTRMLDLFAKSDTLIKSRVFNPDPITTSQKVYGENGLYKHKNGAASPELTAELKTVNLTLSFQNDTFYAVSPYIEIADLESPFQDVFLSTSANFDFNRNNSEFREMNCLFHIETLRKYLATINLPLTGMKKLKVDPTAYQGQDQSRFSYSQSNPALFFGTGGVPDAEDADVIVHEYSHGIADFISPGTTSGQERLALEEANADFMACQYSKALSVFNWRQVFNWDGHNEFWGGRNANSTNVYPKDLNSDFYVSSVIWSSMMNNLSEELGRDVSTRLLLNSIYNYNNNISMQDAADLLVQADKVLYNNSHSDGLRLHLTQRGFAFTNSVHEIKSIAGLKVINSDGFAKGSDNLTIFVEDKSQLSFEVVNLQGNILEESQNFATEISINPNNYRSGIYFLKLRNENGEVAVVKLMKEIN